MSELINNHGLMDTYYVLSAFYILWHLFSQSPQGSVTIASFLVQGDWSVVGLGNVPKELGARTNGDENQLFISKALGLLSLR